MNLLLDSVDMSVPSTLKNAQSSSLNTAPPAPSLHFLLLGTLNSRRGRVGAYNSIHMFLFVHFLSLFLDLHSRFFLDPFSNSLIY